MEWEDQVVLNFILLLSFFSVASLSRGLDFNKFVNLSFQNKFVNFLHDAILAISLLMMV